MDLYALDINAQAILPGTRICTYQGSITLRTVYCTTYGNTRYLKYNILQYLFTTIQYIAICVIDNTIYCNIRQIQNNILYCQDTPIQYIVAPPWGGRVHSTVVVFRVCVHSTTLLLVPGTVGRGILIRKARNHYCSVMESDSRILLIKDIRSFLSRILG